MNTNILLNFCLCSFGDGAYLRYRYDRIHDIKSLFISQFKHPFVALLNTDEQFLALFYSFLIPVEQLDG